MKRRHRIFTDHSKLRLELFFFDEMVQMATSNFVHLEMPQGVNSNAESLMRNELMPFDFGKNRESLILQQQKCRDFMRFSV